MNDLQIAREKHTMFAEWRADHNASLPYDMVVSVLTTGFWPTYKVLPCHSKTVSGLLHQRILQ